MKHKLKVIYFLTAVFLLFSAIGCPKINTQSEGEIEREIFDMINQHRISNGLNPLEWNDTIAGQCRIHSRDMASGSIPVGHDGFDQRVANISNTIVLAVVAENVSYYNTGSIGSSSPASIAVNGWIGSSEHRVNVEGDFNLTGVGVEKDGSEYYFTQIYVKSN